MGAVGRGVRAVWSLESSLPPLLVRRHIVVTSATAPCHAMPWFLLYAALHLCCRWTTELSQAGRLPNLEKPTVLENR